MGQEVCALSDRDVLSRLKAMQSQFPDWVWREMSVALICVWKSRT
jgi:hypothetical protein